jgi:uncharacterized protein YjbJ (UPF0337 family)
MDESDVEPTDSPATWENVAVGKAKEVVGHVIRDDELGEEGEDQQEIAHEVRQEFNEEQRD